MPVLLVGLTGGIGSGKSTVARLLAEHGAVVIDADRIAREVVEPGEPAYDAVVERFGRDVLTADGSIDRPALAGVVFGDEQARQDLNGIVHPAVGAEMARRMAEVPDDAVLVLDVPLLVEGGARAYDLVVVVEAPLEIRLDRLEQRGVDRDDARARIKAQASDEERRAAADVVLDNAGDLASLGRQVDGLWADLETRRDAKTPS